MKNGFIELIDLELECKIWKERLKLFIKEAGILLQRNSNNYLYTNKPILNQIEVLSIKEHIAKMTNIINRIVVKEQELKFYNKDFPVTRQHEYYSEHIELRRDNDRILQIHIDIMNEVIDTIGVV